MDGMVRGGRLVVTTLLAGLLASTAAMADPSYVYRGRANTIVAPQSAPVATLALQGADLPAATANRDWSYDFAGLLRSENAPSGSTVSWTAPTAPAWLTLSPTGGRASGKPTAAGDVSLEVVAKSGGLEARKTYTITVGALVIQVSKLSAGDGHTCAVTSDAKVMCWGNNAFGQLGNGTTTSSEIPVEVSGLSNVTSIAANENHTCAITSGGGVSCWGSNEYGELGKPSGSGSNSIPSAVSGLTGVTLIVAATNHFCALKSDATVSCWGFGLGGNLGNGVVASSSVPVVAGVSNVVFLAAGGHHTCAVISGGTVSCWGTNRYSQVGKSQNNGTYNANPTPTVVAGLSGATSLSLGGSHSCAVTSGGGLSCWGYNGWGQLGNGNKSDNYYPNPASVTGVSSVAAATSHTCVTLTAGGVSCWGKNQHGQLGNSSGNGVSDGNPNPAKISGLSGVGSLIVGGAHTCATMTGGVASCWGRNNYGQLGKAANGDTANPVPTPVAF
jgi:alpha-tubulin suppressor-like RCC1 family protein